MNKIIITLDADVVAMFGGAAISSEYYNYLSDKIREEHTVKLCECIQCMHAPRIVTLPIGGFEK